MSRSCIICGARARRSKPSTLSFHQFPKNEQRRSKWLEACKLDKNSIKENGTFICSNHFNEEDFEISVVTRTPSKRLAPSAVPMIEKPRRKQKLLVENQSEQGGPMEIKKNKSTEECLFTSESADIVSPSAWSLVNMPEDPCISKKYEHLMNDGDLETEPFFTSKASRHYYNFMKTSIAERRKVIEGLRIQTKRLLHRHESIKNHLINLKLLPGEATTSNVI